MVTPNKRGMEPENGDWRDLGARIKRLRQERGMSQADLATPAVSASYLSLIESGTRRPSTKVLAHVAARLDVDPDELLGVPSRQDHITAELTLQEAREAVRVGDDAEAERLAKSAGTLARAVENSRLEAKAHEVLGGVFERRNRIDLALEVYRQAETLWAPEPPHLSFQTIAGIARCHQALGDPRLGAHVLENYLLKLEGEGMSDPTATMRAYAALVNCYSALGLSEKAADAAERAQALTPHVPDPDQIACMNMNVARSLYERGRMDDALDALRQAERAYLAIGWEIDAAIARLNRAIVQIDKGEPDEAKANLMAALTVFKAADHSSDVARALNELGRLERTAGNLDEAKGFLHEAARYMDGADFFERALNLRELGTCVQADDPKEAKALFRRAIDLYLVAGAGKEAGSTYKLLGDVHHTLGELEDSAHAYRAGIEAME